MGRRKAQYNTKKRNHYENAIIDNHFTFTDYLIRMKRIAISMFEWQNLPDSMDERFLETCLFNYGKAALLWEDKYGCYINTKANYNGNLNIYNLPTKIECYSNEYNSSRTVYIPNNINGKSKNEEAILVFNNQDYTSTFYTIFLFAQRLADAQRTADVNIKAQKTPVIILTDENQVMSMLNTYEQYDGNTPLIIGNKSTLNVENVKVLKTDAPYIADKIMDYKQRIWNEFLNFLGVNNIERYKKERMVTNETEQNNEEVNYNLQSFLLPRQKAAKEFNDKYGLSGSKEVKVRLRSDLDNIIKRESSIIKDFNEEVENE